MSTDNDLAIVFNPDIGGADARYVRERLDLYNVGVTGVYAWYPVQFFAKSDRGETLGGVLGSIWGGWLHIAYLWVDDSVRGKDWGTRLMDQAEAYGREHGCHSAMLDTHSFQARPFYEARGYEVFGTLDDYPEGHKKFFLRKKL
ncbi:MAG: GNAT family N-acetyltransferase [Proteobacteria bacterium]|nr:GNAT family N-acetyltransferase [Pseudomonadota bacterium]